MKNSVWFFALEKRKLVLKKYPAKKSKKKSKTMRLSDKTKKKK